MTPFKRAVLLLGLVLSPACAGHAQVITIYTDRALGVNGFVGGNGNQTPGPSFLAYAPVRVCAAGATGSPCTPLLNITDIFGNPLSVIGGNFGQLTTDVVGRFSFGCPGGNMVIQVAPAGSNTPQLNYQATCPTGSATQPGGASGDIQTNNGAGGLAGGTPLSSLPKLATDNTFTNNDRFKGQDPFRDVTAYGASGSNQTTTLGATFSSGSTTLTLTSALDFKNGQGVSIPGAGSTSTLTAPTGTTVTPCAATIVASLPTCPGGTGAATYQYQVIAVDTKWGPSAAASAVSISNGNASLGFLNYNKVTWTAVTGALYYCVYGRASGSMTLQGCTPNLGWYDYGLASGLSSVVTEQPEIPSTPPVSAGTGRYFGNILSGGGTTTLTMDTAAGTTLASGTARHSDSAAIQAAWNASATGSANGDKVMIPCGSYQIPQPIQISQSGFNNPVGNEIYGESEDCVNFIGGFGKDIFLVTNLNTRMYFHDFHIAASGLSGTGAGIRFAGGVGGNGGNAVNTARIERVRIEAGGIGVRVDSNIIVFHMDKDTISQDVDLMFGEPGNPVQIDSFTSDKGDYYTNPQFVNWPCLFCFNSWGFGNIDFTRGLIEGSFGALGTANPWFRIGGMTGDMVFHHVEFATESSFSTGASFQAWPGLAGPTNLVFEDENTLLPDIGGGVFNWSAGSPPKLSVRDSSYSGSHPMFSAATDLSSASISVNGNLPGSFTTNVGAGFICIQTIPCPNNNTAGFYYSQVSGTTKDAIGIDNYQGNPSGDLNNDPIFHVAFTGAIYERENAAPTAAANQDFLWADSTAHSWEFQNNNSGVSAAPEGAVKSTAVNLTAQAANIGSTTLFAVPAGGQGFYRATCYTVITQAATTSSTLPNCFIGWTDVDTSVVESAPVCTTLNGTTNTVGSWCGTVSGLGAVNDAHYVKASTNITYNTQNYASVGGTAMQYAIHIRLEYLGP